MDLCRRKQFMPGVKLQRLSKEIKLTSLFCFWYCLKYSGTWCALQCNSSTCIFVVKRGVGVARRPQALRQQPIRAAGPDIILNVESSSVRSSVTVYFCAANRSTDWQMQQTDDMEVPLLNDSNCNRQKSLAQERDGFSHQLKDSEVIRAHWQFAGVEGCVCLCVCVRWLVAGAF